MAETFAQMEEHEISNTHGVTRPFQAYFDDLWRRSQLPRSGGGERLDANGLHERFLR